MNPLLAKIQEDIKAKVAPELQEDFINAVKAGKHILFDPSTHQNMELIKNPDSMKDPVNTVAKGVVGLGYLMYMQSKRQISPDVLIPALVVLMCEVFDFAEQTFGLQINNQLVAATTKELMAQIYTKLGVTPEHLQQAVQKGQQEIQESQRQPQQEQVLQSPGMLPTAGGQNAPV